MEKEKLIVKFDNKQFEALLNSNKNEIEIGDNIFHIELIKEHSTGVLSFLVNNQVVTVEIQKNDNGLLTIIKDGFSYEVQTITETEELLQKFTLESQSSKVGEVYIKAPMPGLIVKVLVSEGVSVKKGDKVIILEAMKMENAISSPVSGIIKKVFATEGKTVEKDAILVEILSK